MSKIKSLFSQTLVYGVTNIFGRMLNFMLVPFYTRVFLPGEYGVVTEFYAYIPFFSIVFTYGLETGYFYFANKYKGHEKLAGTSFYSLLFSSFLFCGLLLLFSTPLAGLLRYPLHPELVTYAALILFFDTISVLPFAKLRHDNKASRFASLKFINIVLNIFFNVFFLIVCPLIQSRESLGFLRPLVSLIYGGHFKVIYVFISNLLASGITFLLLYPEIKSIDWGFDKTLWKEMLKYSWPLLILGFAGMINETLDRIMLKYLYQPQSHAVAQVGIYGACYKLSIFMTLAVQSFRFAAEPFFFSQMKAEDSKKTYATVMKYFVVATSLIFLFVMLYIDVFIKLLGSKFRGGEEVIPILLLANLFLGIFYTLSLWFKQTEKNMYGAWISIFGAVLTLAINFAFIPTYGYMACAWATLICYFSMAAASLFFGQKVYPIPYPLWRILFYISFAVLIVMASRYFHNHMGRDWSSANMVINTFLFIVYVAVFLFLEKPIKSLNLFK